MKNPFEYGGVVGQGAFCNRKQELEELRRVFENAGRLFMYSDRRVGKTSLVKLALSKLPQSDFITAYVDLWPTTSGNDLALRLAKAVGDASASTTTKLINLGKKFFSSFQPSVSIDQSGAPQLVFGLNKESLVGPALEEVLQALPKIAEQSGKTLVVVFDEFQQIAEYESDTVEKTLRSSIQHHQNIAYVFLGSRKHVIEAMFLDKSRPLYRSAAHYPLGMIDLSAWEIFVSEKFAGTGKNIDRAIIERIYGFTQGHPFYTQHLCHAIWELTTDGSKVTDEIVKAALNLLLDREAFAYTALWESLASNQKTLIEAIASAKNGFKPFSAEFIKNSGLRTPSNIQRAAEALWQRDLIDRDDKGSYYIPDKFFKFWLLKRAATGSVPEIF